MTVCVGLDEYQAVKSCEATVAQPQEWFVKATKKKTRGIILKPEPLPL